jgi:hypothetical protein
VRPDAPPPPGDPVGAVQRAGRAEGEEQYSSTWMLGVDTSAAEPSSPWTPTSASVVVRTFTNPTSTFRPVGLRGENRRHG